MKVLLLTWMLLATSLPVTELSVLAPGVAEPLKIELVEGEPARFVAKWTHTMPTPGWTFDLDGLDIDGDRIVIELTANRPGGMVAQVEAPATAAIPLGALERGRYFLEIELRLDKLRDHRPAFAAVVEAG